jgi:flagellar basal body-associated protein FliL
MEKTILQKHSVFSAVSLALCGGLLSIGGACRPQNNCTVEKAKVNAVVHMETFVLNIGNPEAHSFLRVGVDLGVKQNSSADSATAALVPIARDVVIGVLASAKTDDLLLPAGKTKVKGELLKALQERMPEAGIQEVYFTEFLVQR